MEDVASVAELAKAYLGSMPSKVSPLNLGLRSSPVEDQPKLKGQHFAQKSPIMSIVPRATNTTLARVHDNGFVTPRCRGRSALYSMARTPYSRVYPASNPKGVGVAVEGEPSSSAQYSLDHDMPSRSKQGAMKRRSSVLDNDIGSYGPIRRIRHKSNLLSSKGLTLPHSGSPVSIARSEVDIDAAQQSLDSMQKPIPLGEVERTIQNCRQKMYMTPCLVLAFLLCLQNLVRWPRKFCNSSTTAAVAVDAVSKIGESDNTDVKTNVITEFSALPSEPAVSSAASTSLLTSPASVFTFGNSSSQNIGTAASSVEPSSPFLHIVTVVAVPPPNWYLHLQQPPFSNLDPPLYHQQLHLSSASEPVETKSKQDAGNGSLGSTSFGNSSAAVASRGSGIFGFSSSVMTASNSQPQNLFLQGVHYFHLLALPQIFFNMEVLTLNTLLQNTLKLPKQYIIKAIIFNLAISFLFFVVIIFY